MQRLRGSDAYAIYSDTPTSPFITLKAAIYRPTDEKDHPDREAIKGFITRAIAKVGPARAGLGIIRVPLDLHHPVWVQLPDFRADDHIHEAVLPSPGGKAQLCDFLSDLVAKPLDMSRPLWEIWVVDGLEGGRTAIVFKVHHALVDGKTLARLIEQAHSDGKGVSSEQPEAIPGKEPLPGKSRLISDALIDLAKSYTVELPHYYRYLQRARRHAAAVRESGGNLVKPFSAPFTLLNVARASSTRIYRYESISLPDFKILARQFDCTINTLVIGVCSEALRRYLQELDALPSESLITAMPVGDPSATRLEQLLGSGIHNNNLAVAILPLYQNITDFGQRLRAIKDASKAAIDHVLHEEGRRFDNYLDFLPGTAIRAMNAAIIRRQKKKLKPHANLVISNVPGPRKTLYALDGRLQMEELLSVGNLMDNGHLNITVWSYVDKLCFSFLFRKDALPDPDNLVTHLHNVVAELQHARAN